MNGWIPSTLLNLVTSELPQAVARVGAYIRDYGAPPYVAAASGFLMGCTVDAADLVCTVTWKWHVVTAHPATLIYLDQRRYSGGADVTVAPPDAFAVSWDAERVRTPLAAPRRSLPTPYATVSCIGRALARPHTPCPRMPWRACVWAGTRTRSCSPPWLWRTTPAHAAVRRWMAPLSRWSSACATRLRSPSPETGSQSPGT